MKVNRVRKRERGENECEYVIMTRKYVSQRDCDAYNIVIVITAAKVCTDD